MAAVAESVLYRRMMSIMSICDMCEAPNKGAPKSQPSELITNDSIPASENQLYMYIKDTFCMFACSKLIIMRSTIPSFVPLC